MGHHMPPMLTALRFLLSSCIAPGWSLLQEEVWAWSTAKRRMHQGNHRLAGTLGTWFLIFIFRKFTAGKGYRQCGLKIDSLPECVPLLCLHTLVLDSLQPPLANLTSFCAFTSQNQSPTVPNQTLWTEWIPTDMINFPTSCIHSVTTKEQRNLLQVFLVPSNQYKYDQKYLLSLPQYSGNESSADFSDC